MKTTSLFYDFATCIKEARKAADAENWETAKQAIFSAALIATEMKCEYLTPVLKTILEILSGLAPELSPTYLQNLNDLTQDMALLLNAEAKPCPN